jgi:hypothetical protein
MAIAVAEDVERIMNRGSVLFSRTYSTGSNIAASGVSAEIFISEEHEWQHKNFDTLLIHNDDSVALGIRLDGNPDNLIPVGAGQTIGATGQNFRNFTIENLDSTNTHTAGKVRVLVQKTER